MFCKIKSGNVALVFPYYSPIPWCIISILGTIMNVTWNYIIGDIEIFHVTKFHSIVINHWWFDIFKFHMSVNKIVVTKCIFKNRTLTTKWWMGHKNDIVVGGNDCSARTDPEPVDELLSQYKDMVSDTESKAGHIIIATIIPLIQDANMNIDVNGRIDALNVGLVSMCQENENYTLINNDDFFKLKDGEINDGYFLNDGTHLNKKGSNRLAKSLGLVPQGKANVDITKPTNNTYSDALKKPVSKSGQATAQSNRSGPRRRPLHQTDHSASPDTRSYSDTNRPMESRQEKGRNDNRDRYSNQWDNDNMAQNLPRCYNCNESNHMVDSCRHRTKVTCFTCNVRGHKAKHCWH